MEFRKLTENRKMLLAFFLAILTVIILFLRWSPQITEMDTNYPETYKKGIEKVIQSADDMRLFNIFMEKDSFTDRNIDKTKADFEKMSDTDAQAFSYGYLEAYFDFDVINIVIMVCVVLGAIAFSEKKSTGMLSIIHSSIGGRHRLVIRRILSMLVFDVGCVLFFRSFLLFACALRFGGNLVNDMGYAIQSVPAFKMLTCRLGIGQFLVVEALTRILSCFMLSLLIWTVFLIADNILPALGLLGGIGTVEYLFFSLIKPGNSMEFLHYCNFFYSIKDAALWKEYKNLNVFSYPVSTRQVIFLAQGIVVMGSMLAAVIYGRIKYPIKGYGSAVDKVLGRVSDMRMKAVGFLQAKMGLLLAECYKLLVLQKGILILVAGIFVLLWFNPLKQIQFMGFQGEYNAFMEQYSHEPDERSQAYLSALKEEVDAIETHFASVEAAYERGEASAEELMEASIIYDRLQYKRDLNEALTTQTDYLENLEREQGIRGWYVNSLEMQMLFRDEKTFNVIILILGMSLICGASIQEERKAGMLKVMHSTINGRKSGLLKKMMVSGILGILLYLVTVFLRIRSVELSYGLHGLDAPVQSFFALSDLTAPINLRTYLIGYFASRCILVLCCSFLMTVLGIFLDTRISIMLSLVLGLAGYYLLRPVMGCPMAVMFAVITAVIIVFAQRRWKGSYGIRN